MSDQAKKVPTAPINPKAHREMLAHAPSFMQSMINITTQLGTKPVVKPINEVRQFTDSRGKVFQEMKDKSEQNGKTIVAE